MTSKLQADRPATASEIREIIGMAEDDMLERIMEIGATSEEILEARTWLDADDYVQRKHHHTLSGRAAAVLEALEAEPPEPDNR